MGVFKGQYYYEVMLKTGGLMQIGFCTFQTMAKCNMVRGIGDEVNSYAFDGFRKKKWNRESLGYGEGWAAGDVIGALIDFDEASISFWRNNRKLGVAFRNIPTGPNYVYFPAMSLQRH